MINFFQNSIELLPGVGKARKFLYNKSGVFTYKDLLFFLPKEYLTLSTEILPNNFQILQIKIIKKLQIGRALFQIHAQFREKTIIFNLYNIKLYNIFFQIKNIILAEYL